MKTLQKEIKSILIKRAIITNLPNLKWRTEKLLSLFEKYANEVIGENETILTWGSENFERYKEYADDRNDLRSDQRQRLSKLLK